ncbi:putative ribosomal protein S24/S35 [Helianthus debilis subsp. tardiflorus]
MRRALFNKIPVRHLLNPNRSSPSPPNPKITNSPFCRFGSNLRFFSTENENSSTDQSNIPSESNSILQPPSKELDVKDVSNKELKMQIEKYFKEKDEEALPDVVESIFRRKITQKHADTDDELLDEFNMKPIDGVNDQEFESDFDELHETDDEIDNLYNAKDIVINRMTKDEFFYMDDKKWEGMIKEAVDSGHLKDTKECEQILQDMFMWEKLLPDHLKKLVEEKYNEIADMVGKRYNPGKDELTITSERFEHREENRKDCLRTLFGLIEEAGKADKLVEDARTSYVKTRLRANQKFMEKLNAKIMKNKGSSLLHA